MPDSSLIEELVETDDEFSRLYEEHQDCERRLDELNHKASLSQEDELTVKQIKRHKLFLKDRMEEIARQPRTVGATA